jgi:NAD-dependent histone deacetylase SIR2
VKARYPTAFVTGKDLFSSSLFRSPESTSLFYTFIAELKLAVSAAEPSPTHHFIKKLDEKGKLMRSYTQNIDGMEKRVGIRCSSTPDSAATVAEGSSRESSPGMFAGPSSQASSSSAALQPFSSQASSFPSSSQGSYSPTPRRSSSVVSSSSSAGGVTMDKKLTKNIQLHGDIHRVRCKVCSASYDFTDEYVEIFREGQAPDCPACEMRG